MSLRATLKTLRKEVERRLPLTPPSPIVEHHALASEAEKAALVVERRAAFEAVGLRPPLLLVLPERCASVEAWAALVEAA